MDTKHNQRLHAINRPITIATTDGLLTRQARVYRGLALHPTMDHQIMRRLRDEDMTITHIGSGKALVIWMPYPEALTCLKALLALPIDWTGPMPSGPTTAIDEAKALISYHRTVHHP